MTSEQISSVEWAKDIVRSCQCSDCGCGEMEREGTVAVCPSCGARWNAKLDAVRDLYREEIV